MAKMLSSGWEGNSLSPNLHCLKETASSLEAIYHQQLSKVPTMGTLIQIMEISVSQIQYWERVPVECKAGRSGVHLAQLGHTLNWRTLSNLLLAGGASMSQLRVRFSGAAVE